VDAEKAVQFLTKDKDGKGYLPYTKADGSPDHTLMGAAWAALHGGYRGSKYQGPNKQQALAKLKKLYKEEGMETPSEKAAKALGNLMSMRSGERESSDKKFVSFAIKTVREATADELAADPNAGKFVFVEGILAGEEPDFEGEILDYKSSKANFQAWNAKAAQLTGGKSVGNLRGQHNSKIAAGLFVDMQYDDKALSIPCVAKVIDPVECDKVREGVYTSFSVGAHYARKWKDGKYTRWTADPFEGSLVDFGAIPMTRGFTYRAADGKEEERPFDGGRRELRKSFEALGQPLSVESEDRVVKAITGLQAARKGLYTISGFAQTLQDLIYLRDSITFEREMEGDESPVTDRVAEATEELLECLAAYTQEQVSEEVARPNKTKENTVDLSELTKDLPASANKTVDPPAAAADSKPTDEAVQKALTGINEALTVLKAAGYAKQPGSPTDGGHSEAIPPGKAAGEKCDKTKEECKDADCPTHKCGKSADECTDEKCMTHKGKKAAAAGANGGEALKRADIEQIVADGIARGMTTFRGSLEKDVLNPLGEQLKAIGEAVLTIGGAPVPTAIKAKGNLNVVTKDDEASKAAQDAQKQIDQDVKDGKVTSAILRIREQGGHRVGI
jgi:hypothetical protein